MAGFSSMRMETEGFANFCRKFAERSKDAHAIVLRRLAFQLLAKIIYKWPVDTGRSRAGWGVAAALLGMRIPSPPKPLEAASGFVAGEAELTAVRFRAVNNLRYSPYLEEGWSAQAPMGAVRISMREVQAELGGGELPEWVRSVYAFVWDTLKRPQGSEVERGHMMEATGITRSGAV